MALKAGGKVLYLPALGTLEVSTTLYTGNEGFQKTVDLLYARGAISVSDAPDGFPLSEEDEDLNDSLPDEFEIGPRDLIIKDEQGIAALSVETNTTGNRYGALKLLGDEGAEVAICGHDDKPFHIELADNDPISLDPATASAEDVANALIALGLIHEV